MNLGKETEAVEYKKASLSIPSLEGAFLIRGSRSFTGKGLHSIAS
jgi:hypothetical protein